jgi:hypothetical protein
MSSSNGSLVIAIKQKPKREVPVTAHFLPSPSTEISFTIAIYYHAISGILINTRLSDST